MAAPASSAAVGMGIITAVSRVVGFARVLVVAAVLGTTYLGNAFQSANSVSNVLFELLAAGALSAVLVPVFVTLIDQGRQEEAEAVAGGVLGVALVVLGAVAALGVVAAPWLSRLLTLGVPEAVAEEQQDLVTFLLRFFLPQVPLYALGTVATAVLHARRRFLAAAAAPMGNTVVMVASLLVLHTMIDGDTSLPLDAGARALLVVAGTGGVVAFVGILAAASAATGFRLRPRLSRDGTIVRALRDASWGIVLHTAAGALLGAAIVVAAAVEGGVVAYQVGFVFFLAPYAVLAQPIQTAILPELVGEAGDRTAFSRSVAWAVERVTLLVTPVAAATVALAGPGMRAVAFGHTDEAGSRLLAAAVAALAAGLLPYSLFLLLARAFYALGDTRTPGWAAVGAAVAGVAVMAGGLAVGSGVARIAVLGIGHSVAYLTGASVLWWRLRPRLDVAPTPRVVVGAAAISAVVAAAAWVASGLLLPAQPSRVAAAATCAGAVGIGGLLVLAGYRLLGVGRHLTSRVPAAGAAAP